MSTKRFDLLRRRFSPPLIPACGVSRASDDGERVITSVQSFLLSFLRDAHVETRILLVDLALCLSHSHTREMPPKKKSAAVARQPLPAPNATHPCASLLPAVLDPASLAERPHPASYHAFLTSPYYPTASSTSEPPTKKRKKDSSEPKLPPALDTAIEAAVVQRKLLGWFDGVKEKRGMPWRKEVDPKTLSQKERTQRGYEVRCFLPPRPDSIGVDVPFANRSGFRRSCCSRRRSRP